MSLSLSILDLAHIGPGKTAGESIAASVELARTAERTGYQRVWYAEHHNMPHIASSAPAVLIAHVGAHTSTIRLGAGGVMLPNHSPLAIAEQFGTLDAMYPGRIDLGLGRAPGSDQATTYALRRDPSASETFPQDVAELRDYLAGRSSVPGVDVVPGAGSRVPLYVLGSSTFGAHLAAALGLPYAFASHFAPQALHAAVSAYRREFQPSEQLDRPHVIAGVNVVAADSADDARAAFEQVQRRFAVSLFGRGRTFTEAEVDILMQTAAGQHVGQMLSYAAVGTPADVRRYLDSFLDASGADELITAHQALDDEARLRSVELLAEVAQDVAV
ncbi:LLM class flavin-dependent oxidoreductase [Kineococcus terrestris]|uniref:LLM class flavin-dependent oxidoreductase n=1 Tax=Kineococcus terrestris TaxID=2044856 RepID=UPI0034DB334F